MTEGNPGFISCYFSSWSYTLLALETPVSRDPSLGPRYEWNPFGELDNLKVIGVNILPPQIWIRDEVSFVVVVDFIMSIWDEGLGETKKEVLERVGCLVGNVPVSVVL